MKQVLLKRVPKSIDKKLQGEIMSKWGRESLLEKRPDRMIEMKFVDKK